MEVGLNLFSIRNHIQTEEAFLNVALKLKDAGYDYLQFSGSPLTADAIKRVVDQSGMPVYLTHMPMDRIVNDTNKLMEEHDLFGCKNIGLGMMPIESILDEDKLKETVELLNNSAYVMQKNGFKFFYHHHHYEFIKHGKQTVFDYIINNAPNVNFTLDTYWLQYGGVQVCDFIKKLSGRIDCVHLKDYMITFKPDDENPIKAFPEFAPIGDGVLDFNKIIKQFKESGAKYYFIEQDNASVLSDGLDQVIKSVKYVKENF